MYCVPTVTFFFSLSLTLSILCFCLLSLSLPPSLLHLLLQMVLALNLFLHNYTPSLRAELNPEAAIFQIGKGSPIPRPPVSQLSSHVLTFILRYVHITQFYSTLCTGMELSKGILLLTFFLWYVHIYYCIVLGAQAWSYQKA